MAPIVTASHNGRGIFAIAEQRAEADSRVEVEVESGDGVGDGRLWSKV